MTAPDEPSFQDLVILCLDRLETEGKAALSAVCEQYPQHAEALRKRVALLANMGLLQEGDARPQAPAIPERLGDFRLIERLGAGGMGVVYLAEQESLSRRVALKLIRPEHLYFDGSRDRFLREAEAIARLQHKSIVPVHLVGEENGLPYFAMAYVDGINVADAMKELRGCAPAGLTGADLTRVIATRCRPIDAGDIGTTLARGAGNPWSRMSWVGAAVHLIKQIADALAHAHAKGVLHRDVKPSNIMLTDAGTALLLDFGLATTADATRITRTGSQMGSLLYMAPEQLEGRTHEIDERTDVYALGVTLYELLTLNPPYADGETVVVRQQILDGAPPPLRERNPATPWDVETVCLCAMSSLREQRYAGMADFARDLGHILDLTPIEARPPSPTQRTAKWIQRHPTRSVAILLGSLLLGPAPALVAWMNWRQNRRLQTEVAATEAARQDADARRAEAETQRREAENSARKAQAAHASADATLKFLQRMLASVEPESDGREARVIDVLDHAAQDIDGAFPDQPEIEAVLHATVGESYCALASYDLADAQFTRAHALLEGHLGPDAASTLKARVRLGTLREAQGRYADAIALIEPICDRLDALADATDPSGAAARIDLAWCYVRVGRLAEAEQQARLARAGFVRCLGEDDPQTITADGTLGAILQQAGRLEDAESILRSVIERRTRLFGAGHSTTVISMNNLVAVLSAQGKPEEALPLAEQVLIGQRDLLGAEHPYTQIAAASLAGLLNKLGRFDEALVQFRAIFDLRRRTDGPEHPDTLRAAAGIVTALASLKRYDEALPLARAVAEGRGRALGAEHADSLMARAQLATVLMQLGQADEALTELDGVVIGAVARHGDDHPLTAQFRGRLGHCLLDLERADEAWPVLLRAMQILGAKYGDADARTRGVLEDLVRAAQMRGDAAEAARWRARLDPTD